MLRLASGTAAETFVEAESSRLGVNRALAV
jgi:hypothetical protein